MHDPVIQEAAYEYLSNAGIPSRYTRGELQRHMVAFAEQVLKNFGRRAEPVADGAATPPSARGNNETSNVSATAGKTPGVASNQSERDGN